MLMVILLVSTLVTALVLLPAIALQLLLRHVGPPPARRPPAMQGRKERDLRISDPPTRSFGLFRSAS